MDLIQNELINKAFTLGFKSYFGLMTSVNKECYHLWMADLQKWLREVHNINFWLYPQENVCWKNNFSTNSFLKYEDCLENALLFVLTHLEEKSCKRKCKVCEKEFTPDLRNVKKSEKDSKKEKWGLCCSKSCAAKLREMSKPGYIPEKVAANNLIRENWGDYGIDEDPADDMYWNSKNY